MNIPIPLVVVFLTFAFSAIGFFIKAFIDNTKAITNINLWMVKKDTTDKFQNKSYITQQNEINRKFNEHSKKLANHDNRIYKIEIKKP